MSQVPAGKPFDQRGSALAAVVFVVGAAVRMTLTLFFPTIHGGDAAARLAHADALVLGYQLPLPQSLVMVGKMLGDDPIVARFIFCAAGGGLAAGTAALLTTIAGVRAGIFAGLLVAFDPLLIHYSIVPYQESVAYGLLAWAFFFSVRDLGLPAALAMAAACLSRYEAWIFLPAFILVSRKRLLPLLAGLPVLGWILWWKGLAPRGLYVLDLDTTTNRLSRVSYLLGKLIEYESVWPIVLASVGALLAIRFRNRGLLFFIGVTALAIVVVVGLGHEYPPGSGLMSERLVHLPVLFCLVLAAVALGWLSERTRAALPLGLALVLVLAARNVRFEVRLLASAAHDPDLALARETARLIEANRAPGDCVSVSARAFDPALATAYIAKVGASFGDVTEARARAAGLADTSPDRDRIAANLKAPAGTVRAAAGCPLLVIVDGAREPPPASILAGEISAGARTSRVLRISR